MGVNEAGRPMIHNNHAYGHDVAEAPKHRRRKNTRQRLEARAHQTPRPPFQKQQKQRLPALQRRLGRSRVLNVATLIMLSPI